MTCEHFFKTAVGCAPYDYQRRLAGDDSGQSCTSQLITVPTGLGKTSPGSATASRHLSTINHEPSAPPSGLRASFLVITPAGGESDA